MSSYCTTSSCIDYFLTIPYWFRQAEMGMRLERIALGTKFDLRKIVPGGKL